MSAHSSKQKKIIRVLDIDKIENMNPSIAII